MAEKTFAEKMREGMGSSPVKEAASGFFGAAKRLLSKPLTEAAPKPSPQPSAKPKDDDAKE